MVTKRSLAALFTAATFLAGFAGGPGACCWTLLCTQYMESTSHGEGGHCSDMSGSKPLPSLLEHESGHNCQCFGRTSLKDVIPRVIERPHHGQVVGMYALLNVPHGVFSAANLVVVHRIVGYTSSGSNLSIRNCSLLS